MFATRDYALVFQARLLTAAARLTRLIAASAFALIVLATFAMFTLAGLAAIHRRIVVMAVLALAAILLFGLGSRPMLLLAHFAIYSLWDEI